ncbi:MAG: DUF423 domain-containing protein [Calothrix sp. C42_A2020_038]|nr:DUF423 domain-containing protein [Calothrix sp. C42_A2020_038]
MTQIFLRVAAMFGALSVAAGAFGTHSLRGNLSERAMEIFEIATRYQMYHALALLAVAILIRNSPQPNKSFVFSGWLFTVGTLLFSGSLYALCLTNVASLGIITPLGGAALITAWITLAIGSVWEKG